MPRSTSQMREEAARAARSGGWSLFSELISAIGVCTAIGFGLDKLFGTWPVLVSLGALAGHLMGVYIAFWRSGQLRGQLRKNKEREPK